MIEIHIVWCWHQEQNEGKPREAMHPWEQILYQVFQQNNAINLGNQIYEEQFKFMSNALQKLNVRTMW